MSRITLVSSLVAAAALTASGVAVAGPLNPPAGPVVSSFKTLAEVEPRIAVQSLPGVVNAVYVISQPGSYYLTGNISVPAGKNGIVIQANNVTLDLGGFAIAGDPNSGQGVQSTGIHLTVRNGTVQDCAGGGIALQQGQGQRVEHVRVLRCMQYGVNVGQRSRVSACTASDCGVGFVVGAGTSLEDCQAFANSRGYEVAPSCTVRSCLAKDNSGSGFVDMGFSNTYFNCTSSYNTGQGFDSTNYSTFTGCTAHGNAVHGFLAVAGAAFTGSTSTQNGSAGFRAGDDAALVDCSAAQNGTDGIAVGAGCRVSRCSASRSSGAAGCGIHLLGPANLVEDCSVAHCNRGILVSSFGSKLVRNACSANSENWNVVAGNYCYVAVGAGSPAFSGNSGGTPSGVTDFQANFSY